MTDAGVAGPRDCGPEAIAGGTRTITSVLAKLEDAGYTGQLRPVDGHRIECITCGTTSEAADYDVGHFERLEGASDPDDMLAVIGATCTACGTLATVALTYGPEADHDDAQLLLALPEPDVHPNAPT